MKEKALELAEVVDAYRLMPRILAALYALMVWDVTTWFKALEEPNTAQALLLTTVWGASAAWFGFYASTGRKWGQK